MTKRNITVMGIALILLIAIAITIILGGKGSPVSVGGLNPHTLNLERLDLQQASLGLRLLDKTPVQLTAALNNELDNNLNNLNLKLDGKLSGELNDRLDTLTLNSLTADAGRLALQLDLAGHLKAGAPLAVLGDGLRENVLSV